MRITLEVYCICRVVLAEKMIANPSDEKYAKAFNALRQSLIEENEREAQQDSLPQLLRRQAG